MSLMSCSSGTSVWRGYNYFLEHKAKITKRINNTQYDGTVTGSNDAAYSVHIDLEHVRKSSCNCPHADGKRIICKHMIALFFTAFPLEAKKYHETQIAYEREAELQAEEDECKVLSFISGLKKVELQEILMQLLYDGPEWQWDKFIREYID